MMFSFQNATEPSNEYLPMIFEYKKRLNQGFYILVHSAIRGSEGILVFSLGLLSRENEKNFLKVNAIV